MAGHSDLLDQAARAEAILRRAGAPDPVPLPRQPGRRDRHGLHVVRGGAAVALCGTLLRWGARARAHKLAMAALGTVAAGTAIVAPAAITPAAAPALAAGEGAAPLLAHHYHHHHGRAGAGPPLNLRTVRHRHRDRDRDRGAPAPSASPSPSPSASLSPDPGPSPTVTAPPSGRVIARRALHPSQSTIVNRGRALSGARRPG